MPIPASLQEKLELFRARGHIVKYHDGLFMEPSWLAVYLGQGVIPRSYDPLADGLDLTLVERQLAGMRALISRAAESVTTHADFIRQYCSMPPP
jgi:tryptophan halogenase